MLKMIMAVISTLRIGKELIYSGAWKNAQVVASFLAALVALAAAFGYDLGVSSEEIVGGAVFIAAVANGLLTVMTSKKVGLSTSKVELPPIESVRASWLEDVALPVTVRASSVNGGVRDTVPFKPDTKDRALWDHSTTRNG